MAKNIIDSLMFRASWSNEEAEQLFDESAKVKGWIQILATLAEVQSESGILPLKTGLQLKAQLETVEPDLHAISTFYESSGHSLAGLLEFLQKSLPPELRENLCYGATVQDITDTWTSWALKKATFLYFKRLKKIESLLLNLAQKYKKTPMAGRTHGQIGSVITFGFKVATTLSEVRAQMDTLLFVANRSFYGQLSGAVGAASFFGPQSLQLQKIFCERLGLKTPSISWTASRTWLTEYFQCLARISSVLSKFGNEIYNLQRSEIGELSESSSLQQIHSITMVHKRNPEKSEHLGTLNILIHSHIQTLQTSSDHEHERDGKLWKVEWAIIPQLSTLFFVQLEMAEKIFSEVEIHEQQMLTNLKKTKGMCFSEALLNVASDQYGIRTARLILKEIVARTRDSNFQLLEVASKDPRFKNILTTEIAAQISNFERPTLNCQNMVESVIQHCQSKQAQDEQFLKAQ